MRIPVIFVLASAVAYTQPSERPEFEVASVRQAPTAGNGPFRVGCEGGPGTHDPGLFTCQNMTLQNLVTYAFPIDFYRLIVPDWMHQPTPMFNLSARVPPNTTREQFNLMLQNLLTDRFKLSSHHETREMAQFDLLVTKGGPKFKEATNPAPDADADGNGRPGAPQPVRVDADGFPIFPPGRVGMSATRGKARLYQPRMTMQALASLLASQLARPVTDATGLTGQYEISLYWVTVSALRTTDDDAGGPTLIQALQDQLGLRLESKKGQADFFVVDHAEKTPVAN